MEKTAHDKLVAELRDQSKIMDSVVESTVSKSMENAQSLINLAQRQAAVSEAAIKADTGKRIAGVAHKSVEIVQQVRREKAKIVSDGVQQALKIQVDASK